jgi:uncharacterized protein
LPCITHQFEDVVDNMRITGSYNLDAASERIWPLVWDPAALLNLIPGCEEMETVGPNEYRGRVNLRLAGVGGTYSTHVKIVDARPPSYCRFEGEAAGPGGSVRGQASFNLKEAGQQTTLEYHGEALIAGPLAGMNPRFVEGVANTLIRQGLAKLNVQLQAKEPPVAIQKTPLQLLAARIGHIASGFFERLRQALRRQGVPPARDPRG